MCIFSWPSQFLTHMDMSRVAFGYKSLGDQTLLAWTSPTEFDDFPIETPLSSGICQLAMFDDTQGLPYF